MITMDIFLQTSVCVWIAAGFLSLPEQSGAHPGEGSPTPCQFVLKNACFEFVGGSKTWSEAKKSCEIQGGELLKTMSGSIEMFLKNITKERNTGNFTWWLGEGVQGEYQEPTMDINDASKGRCTYMKLNHLQLITTSDCSQRRGFLCTYNPSDVKISQEHKHTSSRLKRSVEAMKMSLPNIKALVAEAEKQLSRMERQSGEPTNDNRDKFIQYLLDGTKTMTLEFALDNNVTVEKIINCSSGILLLSMKKCDIKTNPNPTTLFEQVFEILRVISVLLGQNLEGEMVIKHPTGTIYQKSIPIEKLGNTVLGSKKDGAFVQFPSFGTLKSKLDGQGNIIAQLTTFSNNPYPSEDNITGTVFNILLSTGGSDIKLANLSEMIEFYLPRPTGSAMTNSTVILKKNRKALTTLNVTDPSVTIFVTVKPNTNASLLLALAHGSPPNSTYEGNTTVLSAERGYRWMITPEYLQGTAGAWYVDISLFNSTWEPGLTLRISTFSTKCMYWDKENEIWSTSGCQVGIESTPELTQCLCDHLTLFGSSFFVMPNHVDLSRTSELFATVSKNYVVLALLCAFFGLYLVTLMWAVYTDRKANSKRTITLLEDNHPGAQYNYLVCVQTGHRKNAGTSANVTVKLIGSEAESDTHNLTDPDKPVFERGAVDMFLLATPFPLGEVRNLRLQHDNSGGHPSWYINRVTIQDLQTRYVYHFFCDCWLSADKGDAMMKKTFNAAKNNEIASFRNIFQSRTSTGFRDEHIWVSIVDPPSRSPFTRAQRVSCCMSLLLCTMAINIAFWNLPIDESSPVFLSIGSLNITWQEIMVGVQSGLLMFPINILIITIFRSIKPRIVSKKHKQEEAVTPQAVSVPSILKDTEEVISMVSRSPRNKISLTNRLESTSDLCPALENVHEFIQIMQGETNSDTHWVYCSKFLLCGLCHLLFCLEKLEGRNFLTYEYQHVLSITNLLVRKSEMVYSSHLAYCPPPVKIKKKKRTASCWLPWWCVFLGWFLLLSISGVSTFFTLLYGFEYGRDKSIKWVMSLGLSLFQSIFILQPLKVIGIAVFFALLLKPVAMEETEEIEQVLLAQQDKCRRYSGRETL